MFIFPNSYHILWNFTRNTDNFIRTNFYLLLLRVSQKKKMKFNFNPQVFKVGLFPTTTGT